ncbi:MAG: hypothetical protein PF448_00090 [Bacteroidales bacterium]|jgi:hypothetical protein|nr:hypothetical protein [Bacteroidales bacterium]
MRKVVTKYTGLLFLSMMLVFSCQPKESKDKANNKQTETNTLKEETTESQNIDIRKKFVLYDLDFQKDDQELHYFAIKTYCKSWDLPLIQMKNSKSDTYPIIQQNDTFAIFKQAWIPDDWENGIILLKPKSLPYFMDFTNDAQIKQISKADDFFDFNIVNEKRKNQKMTTQDYETQYKSLLIDVDNFYDFQKKLEIMDSQFIDYSKTTKMTNEQFIESYLSLKYHLEEKNHELIAHCLMQYPFEFINQGKKETIKSPKETLNRWDTIFSKQILQALSNTVYWRLNTEGNAIYINVGELWFQQSDNRVKITKISELNSVIKHKI